MSYYSPISNRNPEPNNRQLLLLLVLFIGFVVLLFVLAGFFLNLIVNAVPLKLEQKLGSFLIPVYEQQSQPSETQTNLNRLLDGLESKLPQGNQTNRDYRVLYIPEPTINALAIPGDVIVIYEGLLTVVESENELMMILGHELGHFANRDYLRNLGSVIIVKMLFNYFLGDLENFQSGIDFLNLVVNSQFSQRQETEADEFGLYLLEQYYGHVAGATDFFERLKNEESKTLAFLSTHPLSEKRIKYLEELIRKNEYSLGAKNPLLIN